MPMPGLIPLQGSESTLSACFSLRCLHACTLACHDALRAWTGAKNWADDNKNNLGLLSATLLALVPWMQVSKSVSDNVNLPMEGLAAVVVAGAAIHCMLLAFNMAACKLLNLGGPGEEGGQCCHPDYCLHVQPAPSVHAVADWSGVQLEGGGLIQQG